MSMQTHNNYEKAFSRWLVENGYCFNSVKQSNRLRIDDLSVKSFDYVIEAGGNVYLVELKGRLFRGHTFESLRGLQNWVTTDDVSCLAAWRSIEGVDGAFFVFAYLCDDYGADADSNDGIEYEGRKYVFIAVSIEDYREYMKPRSPRWDTVNLSADDFRVCASRVRDIFI
jgi:hypothetical protein